MDIRKRLQACVTALTAGDLPRARTEAEAAYRTQPNSPSVLQLLGVIHCQTGDPARGADYLRRAIARGADTLDNRVNLARALVETGGLDEAAAVCAPRPGEAPPPILQRMRADILKAQGRAHEAIDLYEEALGADPDSFDTWNNLGNARCEMGDLEGGLVALGRARALNPASPIVHLNISRTLEATERHEESLASFAEAARLAPDDPVALRELGRCLHRLGRSAEALPPLGSAVRLAPADPANFVALGEAFAGAGDLGQAERSYRFAIQVDPACAPAYLNLGILLEQANRMDELAGLVESAEASQVAVDERDYLRALLLRRRDQFEDALRLAQSAFPASLDPALKAQFIGQVADRIGEVDTAFWAFEDMNRITAGYPEARRFDGTEHRRHVEGLAAATTAAWVKGWSPAEPPSEPPAPAFLMGFLRSGTTLLDTILMGHEGTHVLEEEPMLASVEEKGGALGRLAGLGSQQVAALRTHYFQEAGRTGPLRPGRLLIDKNPLASLRAPLIHRIFPDARFIFTLRHPCDVVLSCFMQNFRVNQAMASFLDLTNAALFYDRVMAYWQQCRDLMPLRVHTIRYEDLVEDVEREVRPLLAFLDLPWDERVLEHRKVAAERGYIRTPSYAQVTEPVYARAKGRWERYRHHLEPAIPILAPWIERFGYEPV